MQNIQTTKARTLKLLLKVALCANLVSTQASAGIDLKALCADCGPKGVSAAEAVQVGAFSQWNPLQFPQIPNSQQAKTNYSGAPGAPLPNAFERPWSMSAAQLDTYRWVYDQTRGSYSRELAPFSPNFVSSFYDSNEGFLWNSPQAPWNVVASAWGAPAGFFPVNTVGVPGSFWPSFTFDTPPPSVPARAASALLI